MLESGVRCLARERERAEPRPRASDSLQLKGRSKHRRDEKADLLIEIKKQRELVEKAKAAPTAKDGLMAAYFGGKKK